MVFLCLSPSVNLTHLEQRRICCPLTKHRMSTGVNCWLISPNIMASSSKINCRTHLLVFATGGGRKGYIFFIYLFFLQKLASELKVPNEMQMRELLPPKSSDFFTSHFSPLFSRRKFSAAANGTCEEDLKEKLGAWNFVEHSRRSYCSCCRSVPSPRGRVRPNHFRDLPTQAPNNR